MQVGNQMFAFERRNVLVNNAQFRFNQTQFFIDKLRGAYGLLVDVFYPFLVINFKQFVQNIFCSFRGGIINSDVYYGGAFLI